MRLDESRQRLRQHSRTAFGERPSRVLLARCTVSQSPGHRRIRRLCRQVGHIEHERAAVFFLERVANNLPRRHRQPPLPQLSARLLRQLIVQRLAKSNRREAGSHQDWFNRVKLRQHLPVRCRILFRELRELRAGAVHVQPLRQICAISKGDVKDRVGIDVFEPVVAELELVVLDHGVVEQERMGRGTDVVLESLKRQLCGLYASADDWPSLEEQAAITGLRQVGGRNHAVVPRAGNDDVKAIFLVGLRSQ